MKRRIALAVAFCLSVSLLPAQTPPKGGNGKGGKAPTPPPITAKPAELAIIKEKTAQIETLVAELKSGRAAPEMVTDVEIYAHAGRMLLDYPDMFTNQG